MSFRLATKEYFTTGKPVLTSLKFLTENEVELAATFLSKHFIKAVSPVDTHQADHGKEDAYAKSGTAFHVEGIELTGVIPSVSGLKEAQSIDGGVT